MSKDKWIKKTWYICTMEYYSFVKKHEIMPFAAIWMNLEPLTQSEVNQKEKNEYHTLMDIYGI